MNENTKPRDRVRALKSSVIQMKKITSLQKEFVISIGNCLGNHSEDLKTIRIPFWRRAQNQINSITVLRNPFLPRRLPILNEKLVIPQVKQPLKINKALSWKLPHLSRHLTLKHQLSNKTGTEASQSVSAPWKSSVLA